MVSFQEEVPLSPEDAELPDMIPVSIRTTLPEFRHYALDRVLAGVLLTWKEFLQLFDIRVEADDYIIKGSNGVKFDLNRKIQDYVNTFRRKLKMYQVTLERAVEIVEPTKGQKVATNSENKTSGNKSSGPANKKLKQTDKPAKVDKRKGRNKQPKSPAESLQQIAQNVLQNAVVPKRGKKSVKSRSPTPPSASSILATIEKIADGPSTSTALHSSVTSLGDVELPKSSGKLKRLSTDHSQVKEIVPSASSSLSKRNKKSRSSNALTSRRSTKESGDTAMSQESNQMEEDDSTNTDDEEEPSKGKKKFLKQNVIKYLTEKVSPRSFLRLRNELMDLREQEKYFKVTTVVPITAGMMEQTFCRKLTE